MKVQRQKLPTKNGKKGNKKNDKYKYRISNNYKNILK